MNSIVTQITFIQHGLEQFTLFSSPEPKAQVSFSDHNLSVVCRCGRRWCKLFTFSTTGPISNKLVTKHP